ncbi:MAG TPA: response regulator [Candidatus Limnocylindrales bacterium]|jgi:CheY-like chemotaxis protein|nr:response regulator [Candidatus Limnocylindrales bacterium]
MIQPRLNVLLVDDDHNDSALFGIAVDRSEYNIWLQTLPDAGLATYYLEGRGSYSDRTLHPLPDLVILDLDMRLTGGIEFLEWRRASRTFSSLPVILFSAFAYKGAIETALGMGANVFLPKPAAFEGWQTIVRQIWDFGMEHLQAAHASI